MSKSTLQPGELKCSSCTEPAVTFVRYSGAHLCANHFTGFVKSRVKRELRKQGKLPQEGTLALAVSGGKDSLTLLHLMAELFDSHRNLELVAITVDEGIEPYRTESIVKAAEACRSLGVEHRVLSFKTKFGHSMDEIVKTDVPELLPCSYCGVLRRTCLNTMAKDLSAVKLATGHNLDDNSQSVLMNICKGDFNKLFRLGPHRVIKPGLIPRIMPLRVIPEKEIYLYTYINKIDSYHGECPYAKQAQRGLYRDVINQLEGQQPGTRHAILNIYDNIYDHLESQLASGPMQLCSKCSEPSTGDRCKSCQMLELVEQAIK